MATMILTTSDGSSTIFSEKFGATYHSVNGAVTESAHVFIGAGLRFKSEAQKDIAVLETGFGTGLNAFMTLLAAEQQGLKVAYTGLELYPVTLEDATALHYSKALQAPEREADFLDLHRFPWNETHQFSDAFTFCKMQVSIPDFVSANAFDLIYFDAFAPQEQPELWSEAVFAHLYAALRPKGVLVTYCAQGAFRRTLKKVGFSVERLPGPPGKREMTRANK